MMKSIGRSTQFSRLIERPENSHAALVSHSCYVTKSASSRVNSTKEIVKNTPFFAVEVVDQSISERSDGSAAAILPGKARGPDTATSRDPIGQVWLVADIGMMANPVRGYSLECLQGFLRPSASLLQTMKNITRATVGAFAIAASMSAAAHANGWYENRAWQFDTSADKANKAAVLDMIERKKGGYYDGFSTTVNNHSNTNIGTQVNCNNVADATGNEAANSQVANSPSVTNRASINADATGNDADNSIGGGGTGSSVGTEQDNSGSVSSGVTGSDSGSTSGAINGADSDLGLDNRQDNSGDQTATINDSTACDMTGSTMNGEVESSIIGPLN